MNLITKEDYIFVLPLQQQLHHLLPTRARRHVQRRVSEVVLKSRPKAFSKRLLRPFLSAFDSFRGRFDPW